MPRLLVHVNENDHIQGPSTAPITLVEYGDYQCYVCKVASPVVKQLQKELKGQLRFVFRHFPLKQSHPYAFMAAQAAEAAHRQNKFWEMHDLLYANQLQLNPDILISLAKQLQLDVEKFKTDLNSSEISQKIESDFNAGVRSGVNGIPCFYINEERYDGTPFYESLKQALLKST
jgi:protein-disulfide isomerase